MAHGGFTLDILQAFNLVPRQVAEKDFNPLGGAIRSNCFLD